MDDTLRTHCKRVLDVIKPASLADVLDAIPRFMGHIDQEPREFYSFKNPKDPGNAVRRRYAYNYYVNDLIPSLTLARYLAHAEHMETLRLRLPSTCKNIAAVTGHLAAVYLDAPVLRIGRVTPLYLKGRGKTNPFRHYMNAYEENGSNRFFDASVYRFLWDEGQQKNVSPKTLKGFNPADIDFARFIQWKGWTQESPRRRVIDRTTVGEYQPPMRDWNPQDYLMRIDP